MILYHASNHRFDKVCLETARSELRKNLYTNSPKGALGFWTAPCSEKILDIGSNIATIEVDATNFAIFDLGHLSKLNGKIGRYLFNNESLEEDETVSKFIELSNELRSHTDIVAIQDASPVLGEVVILNPDCIKSISWKSTKEMKDIKNPEYLYTEVDWDTQANKKIANIDFADGQFFTKPNALKPTFGR